MVETTPAFLRHHRDEIVEAWRARTREEPGEEAAGALLEPCIRPLLDSLAGWLEGDAGGGSSCLAGVTRAAAPALGAVGLERVVRGLSMLRATVLRLLLSADAVLSDPGDARRRRAELARLHLGFDTAILDPVVGFARARERRIAELTARQDALRGADVRYRNLVRLSPDAVLVIRRARLTFANPAALALVGRPAGDLLGRTIYAVCHPSDHDALRAGWARMVRERRRVQRGEVRIVRPCGEVRVVEVAASAFRDAHGDAIQLVLRDVTARRQAEDALRAWLEAIPALAFHCDASGAVLDCNRRWLEFTGQSREQVRGYGWTDAVHPEDLESIALCMRRALESEGLYECEFRMRRADGAHRWILARASPLRDRDGRVSGWMGIGTDIEEHRRMEESLRESDRRKSDFLGILSHELRTPLAPIRAAAALLRAAPGSAEASWAAEVVARQAAHLTRLVDDLLDATRISHGKLELRRARVDLRAVVRRTGEDLGCLFADAGVTLRVALPDAAVPVDADEARIAQALGNLLHNAVKFTPAGGQVTITLAVPGGRAELAVRDTGVGMDPAEVERLLAPFAQGDEPLARQKGGLGLGLAVAKELVELHGGAFRAASEGRGRGAEFVISLPLAPGEAPERAPAPPPASAPTPRTVLVIDDARDAADTVAQLLSLEGHRVHVARDGRTGLALARAVHPDLVLCDIDLPDVSGYELAPQLRAEGLPPGARLVALTGYAQPEDVRRAREAGFDLHLPKPLPIERLDALLSG